MDEEGDQSWSFVVFMQPSRLHVNRSHDYHMIVYRTSDVKASTDR